MTRTHATAIVIALVLLATVVTAGSVATTASHFSGSESLEDNHLGAADEWGIDLAVEEGNPEITATVTNEHRFTETVTVELEVGNVSESEEVTLEGGETDSVTFTVDDEAGEGDLEYVVTAAGEEVYGTVPGGDEEGDDSAEDDTSDGDDNDTEAGGEDNDTETNDEESVDDDLEDDEGDLEADDEDDADGDESGAESESPD